MTYLPCCPIIDLQSVVAAISSSRLLARVEVSKLGRIHNSTKRDNNNTKPDTTKVMK